MRVLFIHPEFPYRGKDLFPIGLGYLASAVEDIAEVSVIDENLETFSTRKIKEINPDIIGITATTPSFPRAMEIAAALKDTGAKIVIGGVHATFMPEEALEGGADIVVRGEGEATLREIVEGKAIDEIRGISYKKNNKIIHNPERVPAANLDTIPFPAHKYFQTSEYGIMSITSSRGCPHSCSYCSATRFWGKKVRMRSPLNVLEELKIIKDLGFNLVRFMDSTFTLDKKRALEICRLMIDEELLLKWSCETRADALDDEILGALRDSGCTLICLGVDSACDEILSQNNRRIDAETTRNAVEKIREHGMDTRAYITFGLPGETAESARETIKFIEEARPSQVVLSLATAYPGTDLWGGPYIDMHERWIAKFHGHGTGGKLYLPSGMTKKEYTLLADYMWREVKRINRAREEAEG
ncbi:B12-binding domain-containing radical SAM protein [archaeon]|nr:B12-binding domain-containing radical SAM protein [archaeon]